MPDYRFKLEFEVRDYECDLSGIVNNAVYQHYLEHARHVFLKQQGIDFADWFRRGISLVVIRMELDYLYPLRSGERFYVGINTEKVSRLRFGFKQDIYLLPDDKPVMRARVIGTSINAMGRPKLPAELEALFTSGF
ncbi:MAG: acyl-CoA thioesterase [Anaerolineales bacterium]|nr:MAG: acyl-CoA thioesterase [Anaerolineales bacterium]